MRQLFNKTTVISGIQYMPFTTNFVRELNRASSVIGGILFPICMCMCLPVFLYYIVLEKEKRLLEFMKINGMRMKNYWIVNYFFNLLLYCFQSGLFFIFGAFVFKIEIFAATSYSLHLASLFGWGLAQVSLSFLLSVFLNKAETATIVGYAVAIWTTTIAVVLNVTVYAPPNNMDLIFYLVPNFTFARTYFHMSSQCAYTACIYNFYDLPREMAACLIALYVTSIVYLLLALYLYQVVP